MMEISGSNATLHSHNVIIIAVDTLRADHLGCYGYYRNTSPNMDSFALDGVKFNSSEDA